MSRAHIPVPRIRRKSLPVNIKTLGDLIHMKRYQENLTLWQLAQKMGITTASVRAWEDGIGQPNGLQIALLTKHLGIAFGERAHALADAQQ
jgi:DNA-binding transcriptional regulator YiaG